MYSAMLTGRLATDDFSLGGMVFLRTSLCPTISALGYVIITSTLELTDIDGFNKSLERSRVT